VVVLNTLGKLLQGSFRGLKEDKKDRSIVGIGKTEGGGSKKLLGNPPFVEEANKKKSGPDPKQKS